MHQELRAVHNALEVEFVLRTKKGQTEAVAGLRVFWAAGVCVVKGFQQNGIVHGNLKQNGLDYRLI